MEHRILEMTRKLKTSAGLEGHYVIVSFSTDPLSCFWSKEDQKSNQRNQTWGGAIIIIIILKPYLTLPVNTTTLQTTVLHLHCTQSQIITDGFLGGWFAAIAEVIIEDVTIVLFSECPLHCQPCWKNECFFTITCHIIYFPFILNS